MGPQEQILSIATAVLQEKQEPQTGESLANAVGKKFGRPVLPGQLAKLLQSKPQVFLLDGGGRWQLRPQQNTLLLVDETDLVSAPTSLTVGTTRSLKRGCYIVFDLEATRQDALSPYTEIIQIAAERWLDGVLDERWMSFVHPEKAVQERILQLTKITLAELEHAPPIQQVLPEFLDFVGDLPLIAHNGASYDGPLIQATCQRLQIPLPDTFLVLDTLPWHVLCYQLKRPTALARWQSVLAMTQRMPIVQMPMLPCSAELSRTCNSLSSLRRVVKQSMSSCPGQ